MDAITTKKDLWKSKYLKLTALYAKQAVRLNEMDIQLDSNNTIESEPELDVSLLDIRALSAIDGVFGKDCKFVHEALKILYKNDVEKLSERSAGGFIYKNRIT